MNRQIPPPPPGFVPEGFVPEQPAMRQIPAPPPGFVLERQYPVAEASNQPGVWDQANHYARDFWTGLGQAIPPLNPVLESRGLVNPGEPSNLFSHGLQTAGEFAPMAVGTTGALAWRGAQAGGKALPQGGQMIRNAIPGKAFPAPAPQAVGGRVQGIFDRLAGDTARMAGLRPGTLAASEAGGLVGAGMGEELMRDKFPGSEAVGSVVGGAGLAAVAGLPGAMVNRARDIYGSAVRTLAPMTEAGGMDRAAQQMQRRAVDPSLAAERALSAPEGISPGRATGERTLMAQERRIMEDDPHIHQRIQRGLEGAQGQNTAEFRTQFGEGRGGEGQWNQRVIQQSAPPGTQIEAGDPDQMMEQAFRSYQQAYRDIPSERLPTRDMGLEVRNAIQDESFYADTGYRRHAENFVRGKLNDLSTKVDANGDIHSSYLLDLRSQVRAERRKLSRRADQTEAEAFRDIFDNVDYVLTRRIEEGLSGPAQDRLRALDTRYRDYKTVEQAMRRGEGLHQPQLESAISQRAPGPGSHARGGGGELRTLSRLGVDEKKLYDNPTLASVTVRNLSDADRKAVHADVVESMFRRTRQRNEDGTDFVDGAALVQLVRDQEPMLRALGMGDRDLTRMRRIGNELVTMQRKPPEAVDRLFEDGPATIMELGAAILGAKSGQRLAGSGMGASLVLAHFASNKMRQTLAHFTADKAGELMRQAATDPKLYAALLTRPTHSVARQDAASKVLRSYLYPTVDSAGSDVVEQAQEQRGAARGVDTSGQRLRMFD